VVTIFSEAPDERVQAKFRETNQVLADLS